MPSRQDQLHSYQFMVQRVVAALVLRETDPAQSPFRRAAGAALASVLVAAIALGAVVVYGVFAGGGAAGWRDGGAVIVEKESGARYVYRDGTLHPVVNYASALLIVGGTEPRTVLVSRRSLAGVARGTPLGIPDAPDSLPAAGQLSTDPWTVCSVPAEGDDQPAVRSALLVGDAPTTGRPLAEGALLGRHPDGTLHLLWRERRHLVRDPEVVLTALSWTSQRPVPVAPALLDALPAGADLARIVLAGQGRRSTAVDGARVGEVFVVSSQGGGRQYAVADRDGLAGITEVQANLLLAASSTQREPTSMALGRFTRLPKLPDLVPADPTAPPATRPVLVDPAGGSLCGTVGDDSGVRGLRVGVRVPDLTGSLRPAPSTTRGAVGADHVLVPPGRAAVVEAAAAPGATGGAISLVTDLGRRHAVSEPGVLGLLGYGAARPVRLPAALVALVPAGGALDPAAARAPAPAG